MSIEEEHEALVKALVKPPIEIAEKLDFPKIDLIHAIMGISGEAGELLDAIKKHVIYNKDLDITNVIEEMGDIEFYMRQLRQRLGISRDECLEFNVVKLRKRYGEKYTDAAAQERADKA